MRKNDPTSKKVRALGEKGSVQNQLRYELYTEAFDRIKRGNEQGNYFEVVSLVDSIITDRLNSLIQHIRKDEDDDYEHQSIGSMVQIFFSEIKERNFNIDPDYKKLINDIWHTWVQDRNFVAHSFVVVTNANKTKNKEDRLEILKRCAISGEKYAKEVTRRTDKIIREIYRP